MLARPGTAGIRSRRLALVVADGIDARVAIEVHDLLAAQGAVPRFIGVALSLPVLAKAVGPKRSSALNTPLPEALDPLDD